MAGKRLKRRRTRHASAARPTTRRQPHATDPSAREARQGVRALVKGLQQVSDASGAALDSLHLLQEAAVASHEERLVRALVEDRVLRDLAALDAAFSTPGLASPELTGCRAVPAAILRWVCQTLNIDPVLEPGVEREVPADSIEKYEWAEGPPPGSASLVRLRVVSAGFRWRGEVIVKPSVVGTTG